MGGYPPVKQRDRTGPDDWNEEERMMGRAAVAGLGLGVAAVVLAFAPAERGLSDAEIAAVVIEANAIDAELGELAATRGTGEAIRAFGRTMVRDHRAVNEQVGALGAKLKLTMPRRSGRNWNGRGEPSSIARTSRTRSRITGQ
jgi:predicted outer membrane protein